MNPLGVAMGVVEVALIVVFIWLRVTSKIAKIDEEPIKIHNRETLRA